MATPGGDFGEGGRDEANPPPGRDDWKPPWDPPADYPPGYGQPPVYGGPPYPPPGYGPPSYPGGYYPAPDYPVRARTNSLAIASLVASFTGFLCCVIGSIVAIVLGVIALNQIKQTRQDGYGMAVAGIVIGVGTLVVFLIIAMFSIHSH